MKVAQRIRGFFIGATPEAQRARKIVKIIVIFLLFLGLFLIVPFSEVIAELANAKPRPLIIGMAMILPSVYLTALLLKTMSYKQGIEHNVANVLRINMAVKFYILVTPGTIVGSSLRWYRLSQPDGKGAEAFVALAFYRLLDTFLSIVFGVAFWMLSAQAFSREIVAILFGLFVACILLWFFLIRSSEILSIWFRRRIAHVNTGSNWKGVLHQLERLLAAIAAYKEFSVWELFVANSAGLTSILFGVLSNLYLAWAVGIELTFLQMGWIYSFVVLVTRIPFSIAGGLGIREFSLVAVLSSLGIQADLALAFSFLLFARGVLLSLLGGLVEVEGALRARRSGV